ncbi:MAG: hypothetical protein K9H25_11250 [Rhodospirillum sp.]|nr:hypothetical protein [Rhodospirillum sp.]MCF8489870.1 hypothetical protein [Rhodospirillum sp.]MCF8499433.1 hypothetical protein [Rhodospirillum sp.]
MKRAPRGPVSSSRPGGILLDLALAVAILGLVVAGGLMAAPSLLEDRRRTVTEARLERAELALMAHFVFNGVLPCPADADGPDPPWKAGECPVRTGVPSAASPLFSMGTLPWWTLGLMEEDALDGWGNRLTYAVSQGMVDAGGDCTSQASGITPSTGAIAVLGERKDQSPPDSERAAYVVLSHGPNGLGAVTSAGVRRGEGPPANPSEAENVPPARASLNLNADLGARLHAAPGLGEVEAGSFDDMPRWKTPWTLAHDLGCIEGD